MVTELGFGFTALLALGADQYRKPAMGMWHHFVTHINSGVAPTGTRRREATRRRFVALTSFRAADFFYCGDAAGREVRSELACMRCVFADGCRARRPSGTATAKRRRISRAGTPCDGAGSRLCVCG
jgi:hypothetical protein